MPAYEPRPLDTSDVAFPRQIADLREMLARNAHDVWAQERLAQGWTYGPRRDDSLKQHPNLVPYEELPDSEKEYDRRLSDSTLAAILALGFRIEPPEPTRTPNGDAAQSAEDLLSQDIATLQSRNDLGTTALLSIWQGRVAEQWQTSPHAYRLLAERLLDVGEPLLAYDVTSEGRQHWSTDVRLRQLEALALARSGATASAHALLQQLYTHGERDEETVGILARTEKDFGLADADPISSQQHLGRAAELYAEAYERNGGYWSGINAATLYALRGESGRASALARTVQERCLALVQTPDGAADYWVLATLGEAALVLGERAEAVDWYTRAAALGHHRLGDLASTRRNARLLLARMAGDRQAVERALRMPPIALALPRHGDDAVALSDAPTVAGEITARLAEHNCLVGYATITGPVDVVFLEALLERGATAYVVLPYDQERYLQDLTRARRGPWWIERANDVLRRVASVIIASPQGSPSSPTVYEFSSEMLHGLALAHARRLDTEVVTFNESSNAAEASRIVVGAAASTSGSANESQPTELVAMLFGDAVHFSRLDEEGVVRFSEHFMGSIGRLEADSSYAPVFTNTWGDGLFFVFRKVRDAALFALELCELINATDWVARGLPAELNLRVGLHAGPVFRWLDPVTGHAGYMGTHISRAARIEPITPPGQVYTSEPFAALAELANASAQLDGHPLFTCEYVGRTPQAKGYGTFPTYHLRRV